MIKTGIFGDFGSNLGSSPSSGASPSVIQAPQTENIKKGKSNIKKPLIKAPGVHPGRPIDWKKRAEKAAAHAAEIARRKAERHQKTLERRAARKAEHQKEVAKRKAERHQKALERQKARKDYADWWKANTKTNKQIAKEAEKEATKRAKAIAKAEDKAYKKWWKDQEKAKKKEAEKEARKREKAAKKAEEDLFMEDIKEAIDQFEKWRKEGKYDAEIFKQALGDIKGLVLTKEGRISRKSDVRDPWIRKALLGRASSTSRFEYRFNQGKYSLRERFKNIKYRAQDLFEYFLDASELEAFGYSRIYSKFEDIEDALLEHNLVEARDLLDELDDELIAAIDKASDLVDYREGLGQSVFEGTYTRTKFYKTSDYDTTSDYIDF